MRNSYIQVIKRLDKFASSFSGIVSFHELAQAVESILEETYGVEYTGIYLFDPINNQFRLLQAKGFSEDEILNAEKTAMQRHPGEVYRSGRMIYIPDTLLDDKELTKSSERSFVVRSRLYLPVMNGTEVVGAFGIVDSKPNAYNSEDIAVLSFICNMAGAIYGNILNQNLLNAANEQIISLSKLPIESPNPVLRVSNDYTLLYANHASRSILNHFGLKEGDNVSNDFRSPLSELLLNGNSVEWETTDGESTFSMIFTYITGKDYINIYGRDITVRKALETELIKRQAKHDKMVANISDVIVIMNEEGVNLYKSPNIENLFGWKPEEVVGKNAFEFIHPEDQKEMLELFHALLSESDKTVVAEFRYLCKNNTYKWVHYTGVNLLHDPDILGILGNYHDISNQKKTELDLKESESRYRLLFENMEEGFTLNEIITDEYGNTIDFCFLEANAAYERHTGVKISDCIGKTMLGILPNADINQINNFGKVALTGEPSNFEYYSKTFNKYIRVRSYCPEYGRFASIFEDITEQKAAEEELNKISQAVEHSPVMTYITDPTGVIEYTNPKLVEISGYSREELIGKNPKIFSSGEVREDDYALLWQTISSGTEWKGEFHNRKKSGELYWVKASISPVFDNNGLITHYIAIEEDITQSKEYYSAIKISNLRFESLLSSIQAGIMVEDELRRVVLVNQYFCDLFSIPIHPRDLVGFNCAEAAEATKHLFTDPEGFIQEINNTLIICKIINNFQVEMKNGTSLERDFVPIDDLDKENKGILWIYRNITERKKDEKEFLRQKEILSGTANAMNHLLTIQEHKEAMQKALEAVGTATGVDRAYVFEASIDQNSGETTLSQRFEWTAPGVTPQINNPELLNMPFSKDFPRWFKILSNGNPLTGLVSEFPENERDLLMPQDIISLFVVPVFVNDRFWGTVGFDDCSKGMQWSENEISILTALAASIGGSISREIIGNELSNAREIAEKATKIKSDFLATMSHEIRTPMNGVIGMTSLLLQTQLTKDQIDYAQTIRISGELLLDLINEILDFAKIESGQMILEEQSFDLRLALEDTIDLTAANAITKKLGLFFRIEPEVPQFITSDVTRLRQILVNLIGNAIKFTHKGEIVISVKRIESQDDDAFIEFSVKDTGIGIPNEKIDSLFRPFTQADATTTRKYGGTGLGLAICSNLVELMGGKIKAISNIGKGSEFIFTIKTKIDSVTKSSDNHSLTISTLRGKKFLIADNNQTSCSILSSIFIHLGVETQVETSFQKAINRLKGPERFDLLIVDNDFQEIEGISFADEMKVQMDNNLIPIVLITYPSTFDRVTSNENKGFIKVNKPVRHSQIINGVINLLNHNKKGMVHNPNQTIQLKKINDQYPLNILVAEDNAINQKLILRMFQQLGYTIQIAANGFEVIDVLSRMKIDIVFMDIQMPEMDGLEATRQIIAKWGDHRPLIIAMTANALQSDKEKYLATGMDDYISKPLTISQINAGIERWALLLKNS